MYLLFLSHASLSLVSDFVRNSRSFKPLHPAFSQYCTHDSTFHHLIFKPLFCMVLLGAGPVCCQMERKTKRKKTGLSYLFLSQAYKKTYPVFWMLHFEVILSNHFQSFFPIFVVDNWSKNAPSVLRKCNRPHYTIFSRYCISKAKKLFFPIWEINQI